MTSRVPKANDRLRIVLLGYLVRGPVGGMAWSDFHYLAGLRALGHDVYFLEDSGDTQWPCYDPERQVVDTDPTYGLKFAARFLEGMGTGDRWAYYDAHTNQWYGPCSNKITEICRSADLLIDLLGLDLLRPWLMQIPSRVLIDKDPVFRQVRHLTDPAAREIAIQHTRFFTFGENIGNGTSTAPADGLPWKATRHPIYLNAWPKVESRPGGHFTTVMLWNSYKPADYAGRRYGMKADSFGPYMNLPQRAGRIFELAAGSPQVPCKMLAEHGWLLRNPDEVSADAWSYQDFIQQSKAEFSVAKHGYVVSNSGWFSERSASYMSTGRPVLVQETGFSSWLPTGAGVLGFRNPDGAIAGIEEISSRYKFHSDSARALAEEYFDSRSVLRALIEQSMN